MNKCIRLLLIFFAIVLFTVGYFQSVWSIDFVDTCCNGLCGACPPSFWECSFMNISWMFSTFIAVGLVLISVNDLLFKNKGSK